MKIKFLIGKLYLFSFKIIRRILMIILKKQFKNYGNNFIFDPFSSFSYNTISVGNDVYIGPNATFSASVSQIKIGNKVLFGPNVTIMGGDHNIYEKGFYIFDVKEKKPENDLPVIIQDDVWIASNVTILKGVEIGTGSVIAAGSLVLNNVPKNTIVGGVPAKVLKNRFTKSELIEHRKLLKKRYNNT